MKEQILKMDREQLIDFLVENWTEFVKHLPKGKEKEYFRSAPDFHTIENMRGVALSLIT